MDSSGDGSQGRGPALIEDADEAATEERARREKILTTARARMKDSTEAETEMRIMALEDLEFRSGNQWPEQIRAERARGNQPCLTVNRIPQFVNQVANDQRQNRPAIRVSPIDRGASQDTSDVIQGLIRHIEYSSNAEIAYDTAFESALNGGYGYFRLTVDYAGPDTFDQEIYFKRIRNPMAVFFDPYSQEPDGSDAEYVFIVDDYSPDEFREKFPGAELSSGGADWDAYGNQAPQWITGKQVRVAEYFYKDYRDEVIHQLKTGETVKAGELAERQRQAMAAGLDASVVKTRGVRVPVVKWLKINGAEILEETEWPGSFIPVIPVYGAEIYMSGKRILEGIVRNAKDPQRMLNYWKSAETETIALAPRAPFIAAEGQIEPYKHLWATANTQNYAYLPYKPTALNGTPVPPPARQVYEPAVQAITQAAMGAAEDLKSTTGVYDAGVGAQSNEVAGVAIKARTSQIQTANFHFADNMKRSMKHAGRICVDLIPKVYDTDRAARIIGPDDEERIVRLNAAHKDESGKDVLYDLSVGRYDVAVDTGPSYATKREAAAESMIEFTRAIPEVSKFCADLIAKNMDWPGAQELADRIKKTLPPALQDDPKQQQIPAEAQAQMAQMSQMIQQLSQHLNEATKVIETKRLELEHKERDQVLELQFKDKELMVRAEIEMAKLKSQGSIELLIQEIGAIKHENGLLNDRLKLLGIGQPIGAPQDFDPEGADGGNYAGIGHVGGSENLTGGTQPGSPMEGNP